jgi:arabinogalactan oligomer/maltooligosaccharide transport system permease protein
MREATVKREIFADPSERPLPLRQQILAQIFLLTVAFTVMFPIWWVLVVSVDAVDPRTRIGFPWFPEQFTLDHFISVLNYQSANDVPFWRLLLNQLMLAGGVSFFSVGVGVLAAYAFSRLKFPGRQGLMLGIITVLMLPGIATIAPLFVLLNSISPAVRASLWGVGIAMVSGALPFAIWNLKGYLDTIPKDLEEAAYIDGASPTQIFTQITLPLAVPALAVTAFLGFLGGWTEFALSWQFINPSSDDITLAMALYTFTGQYAANVPLGKFAALSLLIAVPVAIVYLSLQKYIVGGLTTGSVK